jgi:hypothetical protein
MITDEGSRTGIGGISTRPPPRLREDVRVLRVRFDAPVVPVATDADGALAAAVPLDAGADGVLGALAAFGAAIPQTLQ